MTRRRPNTSRKAPADLLHGWESDLFGIPRSPTRMRSLFDSPAPPGADSGAKPNEATDSAPTAVLTTYAVQCYVTVRVVLTEVMAADPRSAALIARDRFCANEQHREAEFVDELSTFLVQVVGDSDLSRTVAFRTEWTPIPADDDEEAEEGRSP